MKRILLILLAGLWPACLLAQDLPKSGLEALTQFTRTIYVIGEKTGGSPEEWLLAEQQLIANLDALRASNALDLAETDKSGKTLLMRAAAEGVLPAVTWVLDHSSALPPDFLDLRDENGLSAFAHAVLGQRQTLLACHPDMERMNPFRLVPFTVTQPYYKDRDPYPATQAQLSAARAGTDIAPLKTFWLEACSNDDPKLRAEVADATPSTLFIVLLEGQHRALIQNCQTKVRETNEVLREMFAERFEKHPQEKQAFEDALAEQLRDCEGAETLK